MYVKPGRIPSKEVIYMNDKVKTKSKKPKGRDPFIIAMIHQRVRSTITPTKKDKQNKEDKKQKQKGWD